MVARVKVMAQVISRIRIGELEMTVRTRVVMTDDRIDKIETGTGAIRREQTTHLRQEKCMDVL
jgi:hypothetical protein